MMMLRALSKVALYAIFIAIGIIAIGLLVSIISFVDKALKRKQ